MGLQDYAYIFIRHWRALLGGLLGGLLVGVGISIWLGYLPRYAATATIAVGGDVATVDQNTSYISLADEFASTYANLATRAPILQAVIEELGLDMSPARLKSAISTSIVQDTHLVEITVSHSDPRLAADIANTIARQLTTLPTLRVRNFVVPVEAAAVPTQLDPTWLVLTMIVGALGLLLVGGLVFLREFMRDAVYSGASLEREAGLPVLVEIHSAKISIRRDATHQAWRTQEVGAWWALAQHCRRRLHANGTVANGIPTTIAVAAPDESDATALVAVNLAAGWAERGERVVLLNTDEHSKINTWFETNTNTSQGHELRLHTTGVPNLSIATWSPGTNGAATLDDVLHALRDHADVVILASPSLLHSPTSVATVRHAHGALLAITSGSSRLSATIEARNVLDLVDVDCWGAVVAHA